MRFNIHTRFEDHGVKVTSSIAPIVQDSEDSCRQALMHLAATLFNLPHHDHDHYLSKLYALLHPSPPQPPSLRQFLKKMPLSLNFPWLLFNLHLPPVVLREHDVLVRHMM